MADEMKNDECLKILERYEGDIIELLPHGIPGDVIFVADGPELTKRIGSNNMQVLMAAIEGLPQDSAQALEDAEFWASCEDRPLVFTIDGDSAAKMLHVVVDVSELHLVPPGHRAIVVMVSAGVSICCTPWPPVAPDGQNRAMTRYRATAKKA